MRSFKSNENIHKKEGGSYYEIERGLGGRIGSYNKKKKQKKNTKKHNIGFKALQRWYIRGWDVPKQIVCLTHTIFILTFYLKAIR